MGTLSAPSAVLLPDKHYACAVVLWGHSCPEIPGYKEELVDYPQVLLSEISSELPVPGHGSGHKGKDPLVWLPQGTGGILRLDLVKRWL